MLRVRRLSASYLDLELPLPHHLSVRIVERPGRWMSTEDLDRIVADLRVVTRAVLGGEALEYGVLTGDAERLDDAILTIMYEGGTHRPVGFNALTLMTLNFRGREEEVLHTGLVMVDPDFRKKGFSWVVSGLSIILMFFHRQFRPLWVTSVTQVPAVFGLVAEGFDDVYPSLPGARRTYRHVEIARQVMEHHRGVFGVAPEAGFDPDRFIITDAYTGGSDNLKKTYEASAKHRQEAYNEFCLQNLDYGRGDDFLQVGQWNLLTARRYLTRSVPRSSLWSILSSAVFLFAGSVLAPVLQWFTASRQLGDLRPWRE